MSAAANLTTSAILRETAHRPWPMPARPWMMIQIWRDLLFAHWKVPAGKLRPLIPASLELDIFEEDAWLTIAPFHMSLRFRGLPILPGMARIPELNCRTYVTVAGKPGIFFFSLDAASRSAVWGARAFYHLPYFPAQVRAETRSDAIAYSSSRPCGGAAIFRAHYGATSPPRSAQPGSIEYFLAERYCLYTVWRGAVYRGDIHHLPWPLQHASAQIEENTVARAIGIEMDAMRPDLTSFAKELKVLIWPLTKVSFLSRSMV